MDAPPDLALTIGFVQDRPASAAAVLGEASPEMTAQFLDSVPARIAAPAFSLMAPHDAAQVLGRMNTAQAAGLIRAMGYADAVTVVRLLADDRRTRLYAELPRRLADEVTRSLQYPLDTVGAWMEPDIPMISTRSTLADALSYVRRRDRVRFDHVFLVGEERQFEGAVPVVALLRAKATSDLSALAVRDIAPLSNRARILEVKDSTHWDAYCELPVAGRKGNILGGLSRAALRRGVTNVVEQRPARPVDSIGSMVVGALLVSTAGLLRAATTRSDRDV